MKARFFTLLSQELAKGSLFVKLPILILATYILLCISVTLESLWITILFVLILLLVSFILNKSDELPISYIDICHDCITKKIEQELNLNEYDLIRLDQLLEEERSLGCGDEVIIYTSVSKPEQDVETIVRSNSSKGVSYNLLHYKIWSGIEQNYYNCIIDLESAGYNKGIDFALSKDTGFDVFIIKKASSAIPAVYFAVNYSADDCLSEVSGGCVNPCEKDNAHLFYKKTADNIAKVIYNCLKSMIDQELNKGA